jgi:hypothetical protein
MNVDASFLAGLYTQATGALIRMPRVCSFLFVTSYILLYQMKHMLFAMAFF